MATQIPLGQYIFQRLRDLGIRHIFGVPGDFNLNLLDHIDSVDGISWVGTCNELNAAYAADGYARIRQLPGVLITTYGVGELSAINGIGGAVAEWVPIIHIVGTTARVAQKNRLMIHHTLGENKDHAIFRHVSQPLSVASTFLEHDESFTREVDRVIETCFQERLPGYIYVPADTPDILVGASRLQDPLVLELPSGGELEDSIVNGIIQSIQAESARPIVLVDLLTQRYGLNQVVRDLVELTGLPCMVTPLAKSVIDETNENFAGLYMGEVGTSKEVKDAISQANVVVHVGRFPSDTNTGGWTYKFAKDCKMIALHPTYVSIGTERHDQVSFVPVVNKLVDQLRAQGTSKLGRQPWLKVNTAPKSPSVQEEDSLLRQSSIWQYFNSFLQADDCIVAEVGSSQFGTLDMQLPARASYYTQIFYSCIGFTVGSTLGTLIARKELGLTGRVILFVGDGSLQMSVQEISTMIRYGFSPTIIVINNGGYTVERVIHGPKRVYNDISQWNYQALLHFFGAPSDAKSYRAQTYGELRAVLSDETFKANRTIQLLECVLHKYDSPRLLSDIVDGNLGRAGIAMEQDDRECGRKRVKVDGTLTQSGLTYRDS